MISAGQKLKAKLKRRTDMAIEKYSTLQGQLKDAKVELSRLKTSSPLRVPENENISLGSKSVPRLTRSIIQEQDMTLCEDAPRTLEWVATTNALARERSGTYSYADTLV